MCYSSSACHGNVEMSFAAVDVESSQPKRFHYFSNTFLRANGRPVLTLSELFYIKLKRADLMLNSARERILSASLAMSRRPPF